ncbi:hypothetical protein CMI39_01165 [Candidatus Pacearchaeota archaeon]|jgi:hypothetical protein|nr:hypothetical protein [Candidatus Pacearchaeota archaeon]|tara:strand:+ start:2494 stop:2946 length:453 start_codon:yes stop_codon:yes gene_type:complete
MKKSIIFIIIILLIIASSVYFLQFNKQENCILELDTDICPEGCEEGCDDIIYSEYFNSRITGESEEKFDAIKLKSVFPRLDDIDFRDVKALGGTYVYGDRLYFNEEGAFNPDAQKISKEGYKTLLQNLAQRFNVVLGTKDAIDSIIILIG